MDAVIPLVLGPSASHLENNDFRMSGSLQPKWIGGQDIRLSSYCHVYGLSIGVKI